MLRRTQCDRGLKHKNHLIIAARLLAREGADMSRSTKAKLSATNSQGATRKVGIKLKFGTIPVLKPQDMERQRREAKNKTTRIFPELPEWRREK